MLLCVSWLNYLLAEVHYQKLRQITTPTYKVLLLGCGNVGKTTIFKQLRKIYGNGFKHIDNDWSEFIRSLIIHQMEYLLHELLSDDSTNYHDASCTLSNEVQHSAINIEQSYRNNHIFSWVKNDLQTLWNDESVKKAFNTKSAIEISDAYRYLFDDLDRISCNEYQATDEDIIYSHCRTTGIVEAQYKIKKDCTINIFDTGGQRSERKKWIHVFDTVHCMVFVVSLNHFDQRLFEDRSGNGLQESLAVFSSLMNEQLTQRYFKNTTILLILNFIDLFEDRIGNQGKSISFCFDEYDDYKLKIGRIGRDIINNYLRNILNDDRIHIPPLVIYLCALYYDDETKQSLDFIINKFKSMMPSHQLDKLHIYPMCGIETKNVHQIFYDIGNILISKYKPTTIRYCKIYHLIKGGMHEIKVIFPLVVLAFIMMSIILIFTPYYALSYLEMAISFILFLIVLISFISMWRSQRGHHLLSIVYFVITLPITLTTVFNAVQVTLYELEKETADNWSSIVLYILFPICLVYIYFIIISITTFYWYWHQMWTLFCFGFMFIIVGLSKELNINHSISIIGICFIILSFIFPIIAALYLKHTLKSI